MHESPVGTDMPVAMSDVRFMADMANADDHFRFCPSPEVEQGVTRLWLARSLEVDDYLEYCRVIDWKKFGRV
jgi:hypothetical protein